MRKIHRILSLLLMFALLAGTFGCSGGSATTELLISRVYPAFDSGEIVTSPSLHLATEYTAADLEKSHSVNSDFVGVLEIPGIGMSEDVVQGSDNTTYYRSDLEGNYRHVGIPFVDYRDLSGGSFGFFTRIYGHNVGKRAYDDRMFGKLVLYRNDESVYKSADLIKFTAYNGYVFYFQIFAGCSYTAEDYNDLYYNYSVSQDTQYHVTDMRRYASYTEMLQTLRTHAEYYDETIDVNCFDRILTLMTCVYDDPNADQNNKYVLCAKLLDTDELADYLALHPEVSTAGQPIGNPAP